jgi:hypothetical protein
MDMLLHFYFIFLNFLPREDVVLIGCVTKAPVPLSNGGWLCL